MLDLIESYSFTQIAVIVIMVAFAVKELISLIDFFKNKIQGRFKDEQKDEDRIQEILDKLKELDTKICDISVKQQTIQKTIEEQNKQISLLTDSDKDQLRSFIVREHHFFCYKRKWIDDFSMDALEKCYSHYTREGGNSYVHDLMGELRALPHHNEV